MGYDGQIILVGHPKTCRLGSLGLLSGGGQDRSLDTQALEQSTDAEEVTFEGFSRRTRRKAHSKTKDTWEAMAGDMMDHVAKNSKRNIKPS